jgi:hypothetical protein
MLITPCMLALLAWHHGQQHLGAMCAAMFANVKEFVLYKLS